MPWGSDGHLTQNKSNGLPILRNRPFQWISQIFPTLFYRGCTEPANCQFSQHLLHLSCHKIRDANRGWINPATYPITPCSLNLISLHQIDGFRAASQPWPSAAGIAAGAGPATPCPLSLPRLCPLCDLVFSLNLPRDSQGLTDLWSLHYLVGQEHRTHSEQLQS